MSICNILDNVVKQFGSIFGESQRLIYAQAPVSGIGLVPGRTILCNPNILIFRNLHSLYNCIILGLIRDIMSPKNAKAKVLSSFSLGLVFLIFAIITPLNPGGAVMNISKSQVTVHTELQSSYIPVAYRREILLRDSNCCQFCGKETEMLCHGLPKCRGGKTEVTNLFTCCEDCRREKEELTAREYGAVKLEYIDFPREVKVMKIRVIFASGYEVEGIVDMLPKPEDKAFYLRSDGNGARELIFVEPGMRIIEMGGKE